MCLFQSGARTKSNWHHPPYPINGDMALEALKSMQVGGWWHYEATQMLHGLRLFWSSTKEHPFPRMLVLDPKIHVKATSQDELMKMHLGLILAGLLSDRVWQWPLLDCSGMRVHQSNDAKHWTRVFDNRVLPYGGPADLKCIDLELTWNYCMEVCSAVPANMSTSCVVIPTRFDGEEMAPPQHCPRPCSWPDPIRPQHAAPSSSNLPLSFPSNEIHRGSLVQKGMSAPDFKEYARLKPKLSMQTTANTLVIPGQRTALGLFYSTPAQSIDVEELQRLLYLVRDQHVVYLSALLLVRQEGHAGAHEGTCIPNCNYEAMQKGLKRRLEYFESELGCHPFKAYFLP
jgi:hypothetical protein